MKTDRELLELAAKAAGYQYIKPIEDYDGSLGLEVGSTNPMRTYTWKPLKNRAQALELAVQLKINITHDNYEDFELSVSAKIKTPAGFWDSSIFTEEVLQEDHRLNATCRVIVHAAAAIGEAL